METKLNEPESNYESDMPEQDYLSFLEKKYKRKSFRDNPYNKPIFMRFMAVFAILTTLIGFFRVTAVLLFKE